MKTLVVINAQTDKLVVRARSDYELIPFKAGMQYDLALCIREEQNSSLNRGGVIQSDEVEMFCTPLGSVWICNGDFLLDPETGDPILRLFKP